MDEKSLLKEARESGLPLSDEPEILWDWDKEYDQPW